MITCRADDIAYVERLERLERLVAYGILFDVELDPPLPVLHLNEGGLAERAAGDYTAPYHKRLRVIFNYLLVAIGSREIGRCMGWPEIVGIRIDPCLPKEVHLASSLQQQLAQLFHVC